MTSEPSNRFARPFAAAALAAMALAAAPLAAPARAAEYPEAFAGEATAVTETSASLSGTVIVEGETDCRFEWGLPEAEGSAPCVTGAGGEVSAVATALRPGATYTWELAVTNEAGTIHSYSSYFTTLGGAHQEEPPVLESHHGSKGHGSQERNPHDKGLYVAYCPAGKDASVSALISPVASVALANHTGWPKDQCLKMDKGSYGASHMLVGEENVHNWLLGGYGNDTVFAGNKGDVIWGDYRPSGQSESERDKLHGGAGADWIYASHGFSEIWTGAGTDHLALVYGHGVIHCDGPGLKTLVMRYLPSNRPWRLIGCAHKKIDPYKA